MYISCLRRCQAYSPSYTHYDLGSLQQSWDIAAASVSQVRKLKCRAVNGAGVGGRRARIEPEAFCFKAHSLKTLCLANSVLRNPGVP